MSGMIVWVLLLNTDTSAVQVGYFVSEEECVSAAQKSDLVVGEKVVTGTQVFTCVPVQGLLTK